VILRERHGSPDVLWLSEIDESAVNSDDVLARAAIRGKGIGAICSVPGEEILDGIWTFPAAKPVERTGGTLSLLIHEQATLRSPITVRNYGAVAGGGR
jgi:hypothetical protein